MARGGSLGGACLRIILQIRSATGLLRGGLCKQNESYKNSLCVGSIGVAKARAPCMHSSLPNCPTGAKLPASWDWLPVTRCNLDISKVGTYTPASFKQA